MISFADRDCPPASTSPLKSRGVRPLGLMQHDFAADGRPPDDSRCSISNVANRQCRYYGLHRVRSTEGFQYLVTFKSHALDSA